MKYLMHQWIDFHDKKHTEYWPIPPGANWKEVQELENSWYLRNGAKVKAPHLTFEVTEEEAKSHKWE